jgi:hypothetical protein
MSETSTSTDIKLQICFGIFAVLNLIAGLAGLHTRDSLGAAWIRYTRSLRQISTEENHDLRGLMSDGEEEYYVGLARLDTISIPSSRISFDDAVV